MLENIKWLFFDVGSTLVDESLVYEDRMRKIANAAMVTYEEVCDLALSFYKQNKKGDAEAAKQLCVDKPKWCSDLERLYPDAEDCLKNLACRFKLGIIANQELGTKQRLAQFGILKYFDLVIASAEIGFSKPDERIFLAALQEANCRPEQATMIGDRIDNDIIPSKQLGMATIWIRQGFGQYWKFSNPSENPDYKVSCLSELCDYLL